MSIILICSASELSRITACLKLNKNTNVCKAKAQEVFKNKDCYMLLVEQNNLGHFLLNQRGTAVGVCSSISNRNNLLVQGNYKTTT